MTPTDFRAIRKRLGLDQAEMAEALGCSHSLVSQIERGLKGDPVPLLMANAIRGVASVTSAPIPSPAQSAPSAARP